MSILVKLGLKDDPNKVQGSKRNIGIFSAIFLIFNRMVGTGIFATPSTIYNLSGSVGGALMMWFAGTCIAASGLMVYLEWGTSIPKNGGEKNYIGYFYKKPKYLALTMFASYAVLLGWAASNSVVFGEYILAAADVEVTRWNQRGVGIACISFCFIVHSLNVRLGLALQNSLGIFKLVVIFVIIISGWVGLSGHLKVPKTNNFDHAFTGTTPTGYGIVNALYNVIWSYIGYSNANYALGEAKNPVRTLKIAAPAALIAVSILYIFVNISYFAVVPKEVIATSGQILAANYFELAFGQSAKKALSVFVALSALGNVMSVIFSQGRIVQELGKDGLLPFSSFFASSKPFNTPMAGLFTHWVVSIIIMIAPPPGDAYNLILNIISASLAFVNIFVGLALIILNFNRKKNGWNPPIKATQPVIIFFFLSSLYLVVAPFVPPSAGQSVYNDLPYYLHSVISFGLFGAGAIYWFFRYPVLSKIWPGLFPATVTEHNKEELEDDSSFYNKDGPADFESGTAEKTNEFIQYHTTQPVISQSSEEFTKGRANAF